MRRLNPNTGNKSLGKIDDRYTSLVKITFLIPKICWIPFHNLLTILKVYNLAVYWNVTTVDAFYRLLTESCIFYLNSEQRDALKFLLLYIDLTASFGFLHFLIIIIHLESNNLIFIIIISDQVFFIIIHIICLAVFKNIIKWTVKLTDIVWILIFIKLNKNTLSMFSLT